MSISLPKITVVTPSYQHDKYLEDCIKSVVNQNYPNLEYIVMDGGSNDKSVDIIKKYESQITYWESKADKGQAHAITKGFNMATGDVVSWINSDDLLCQGSLFAVAESYLKNTDAGLFYGNTYLVDEQGELLKPLIACQASYLSILYGGVSIFQGATFYNKKIYDLVGGFDENWQYAMEYEILYKIAKSYPIAHIDKFLACFRKQPLAKSSTAKMIAIGKKERNKITQDIEQVNMDSYKYKMLRLFYAYGRRLEMLVNKKLYIQNKELYSAKFSQSLQHLLIN